MSLRMLVLTYVPNLLMAILLCPFSWGVMMIGCACFGLAWGVVVGDVVKWFGWEDEV